LWIGIALGSLVFVMLQHLTGGGWGWSFRRVLEAARDLPLMLILFIPILFGARHIYPWTDRGKFAGNAPMLDKIDHISQSALLHLTGGHLFRHLAGVAYFLISGRVNRIRARTDDHKEDAPPKWPGDGALHSYIHVAAIDWVMSSRRIGRQTILACCLSPLSD